MASNSSPDYKALFLRELDLRRQAEDSQRKAEESQRKAEEEREQEKEGRRRAEEEQRRAEEERDQRRDQTRQTTFGELIQLCHNLFSRSLRVEDPSRSTTGKIPPPTGKRCPLRLLPWTDCASRQQAVYRSVCKYLEPPGEAAEQLFSPRLVLEGFGQEFSKRPISSEQDLESYERFGVENYVRDIIAQLCKKPAARDEFRLGDGVRFDNHANALDPAEVDPSRPNNTSSSWRSRPDQFCIRRVDGDTSTLLTTVEYKPPHKLSVENLRAGLRPMDFWAEVVRPNTVPTEEREKLSYNAARLTGSAVVQEFHVMIQEGLEYSYLTNGLALVLLRVPYDNPSTLYYHLCEPNIEVGQEDGQGFQQPVTAIARVLCLCLMSFGSLFRDQEWRNNALAQLPTWTTSFDHIRAQIPEAELRQNPPGSEYSPSVYTSSNRTTSEYLPSSSPAESPTDGRRVPTRSRAHCAPLNTVARDDSSDSDTAPALGRKRGFSQVTSSPSSPSVQRSARQTGSRHDQSGQYPQHSVQFCTQRCLLGLQQGGILDDHCPNIELHRRGKNSRRHLINAEDLVQRIKQQLDENLDHNCTPMGGCGASGAPFKITCSAYGYTVVGKGTTSRLWNEVSREEVIYRILSRAQGSAVPVFLGAINLAKIYFLHGAGEVRHMLLMAWGGEPISKIQHDEVFRHEISRSKKEIHSLGILHLDLRPDNILWNAELDRILIIDFHRSELDSRPIKKRLRLPEKLPCGAGTRARKRLRAV
ncbi:hypothetical protein BDV35DRAFT_398918 [Aspergillus flavus]|uniref:Protein kinase domain-containing protein n=1 Tax=Aspergillus flavus TaxID=5059 RepID=A0A5N6GCL6_ASPFL|nr:hypothetical protein BDV35DRAFT_398918 [Aspergillus flavus]